MQSLAALRSPRTRLPALSCDTVTAVPKPLPCPFPRPTTHTSRTLRMRPQAELQSNNLFDVLSLDFARFRGFLFLTLSVMRGPP